MAFHDGQRSTVMVRDVDMSDWMITAQCSKEFKTFPPIVRQEKEKQDIIIRQKKQKRKKKNPTRVLVEEIEPDVYVDNVDSDVSTGDVTGDGIWEP